MTRVIKKSRVKLVNNPTYEELAGSYRPKHRFRPFPLWRAFCEANRC
jgi:hypothetical protein